MAKTVKKKVTSVKTHPLHVPVSKKNPDGLTTRHQHSRRINGTYLKREDLEKTFKDYPRKGIGYPTSGKIPEHPDADKYDELIAVWVAYFNEKLKADPKLEPDVFKALLGSESGFQKDTPRNPIAFGIAQITKQTLTILQDADGEAKSFIFKDIRLKDLKDPNLAIPMGVRWLVYKSERAKSKLGQAPTAEDIILEYKGLLKSRTSYKDSALESFRRYYGKLKK